MNNSIIKKIQKKIVIINIVLICIAALYYYFNKNKFDTLKTYIDYTFQEKLFFRSSYPNSLFTNNKIKFFLNDLDFNKKYYGINDLKYVNSINKINVKIDHSNEKISFSFVIKKDILNNIFKNNNDEENLNDKNIEIINKFIDKSLNKFHTRIYEIMISQKQILEKKLNALLEVESKQGNKISDRTKMEITQIKNSILEISDFTMQNNNLIIVNDYSKKFRKLHLNTNEYLLSILLLLFLGNILIRNFDKILK